MRRGLAVFARDPLPGRVKSRLAASVGAEAAATLYEAMLQDVLLTCRELDNVELTLFWECAADRLPALESRYGCSSCLQDCGDLGQRMQAAFSRMFSAGIDVGCIVGSDAPDLPLELIEQAFSGLESGACDVLFGPAADGGYYLLGMREIHPELFDRIPWSTPRVTELSLAAVAAGGKRAMLLDEWSDIDTLDDLHAFRDRPAKRGLITRAVLNSIRETAGR